MIGGSLAQACPGPLKLGRLPDEGLPDSCLAWHPDPAAKDNRFSAPETGKH